MVTDSYRDGGFKHSGRRPTCMGMARLGQERRGLRSTADLPITTPATERFDLPPGAGRSQFSP